MKNDRSAYFVCCLVKMFPSWEYIYSEWKTYWTILKEEIWDKSLVMIVFFIRRFT